MNWPVDYFLKRPFFAVVVVLCPVLGGGTGVARAAGGEGAPDRGPGIERVVRTLSTKTIFVHPDASPSISKGGARQLRKAMQKYSSGPVFVALLPGRDAEGREFSTEGLAGEVGNQVRRDGTYVVVSGPRIDVVSNSLKGRGRAQSLMNDAVAAHRENGLQSILTSFIYRLGQAQVAAAAEKEEASGSLADIAAVAGLVLLICGVLFVGFRVRRRSSSRSF